MLSPRFIVKSSTVDSTFYSNSVNLYAELRFIAKSSTVDSTFNSNSVDHYAELQVYHQILYRWLNLQ